MNNNSDFSDCCFSSTSGQKMFRRASAASGPDTSDTEVPPTDGGARKLSLLMLKAMSSSGPRASITEEGSEGASPQVSDKPRPSLLNMLATKQFSRRMSKRFSIGGYGGLGRIAGSSRVSEARSIPKKEPTYKMEPNIKFNVSKVERVIKNILEASLDGLKYDPKTCAAQCKGLSEEIKNRVKLLNYDRYKIVASVVIGENKKQGVMVSSRCAWDDKLDGMANHCYQSPHIFCSATVYGLYTE